MEFSFRGDLSIPTDGSFRHQRGQALVEYILILVVTVALILGLMFEFNTAFQAWANNYFGDYLTCLLETGELPSIGGSPGDSGVCNQFFQEFSLKNGRPSIALNSGGKGSKGSSSGNSSDAKAAARPETSSSGRFAAHNGHWNGGSGSSSSSGLNSSDEAGGKAAETKTGDLSISSSGGFSNSSRSNRGGDNGRQLSGRLGGGFKKDDEAKKGYVPGVTKNDDQGHSPKRVKIIPTRKIATEADESQPLTFGSFIRLLIIAAIVIALVVVIGGQLLQISKGMDSE